MEYNKEGEVNQYYNLDDILRLNIPESISSEMTEKFNKRVFWDNNGSCRMGYLRGLEMNYKLSDTFYIIEVNGQNMFIPTWKSITKV